MDYQSFKKKTLDKGFNPNNDPFGYQCVGLFDQWCVDNGVKYPLCKWAEDLWEQRATNGILNSFKEVEVLSEGDVVVFKRDANWTPSSHVALFDSDLGNGFGLFLGQNQGGKYTHPNGGSTTNLVRLPYSATYRTAFRLKDKTTKGDSNMTKRINGDLFSSLITDYDANIMNADSNRTTIDRIVV